MNATLSILGLYQYDNTVFDLMQFPENFSTAEQNTVKNSILAECAELEILYPSSVVMKNMIGVWSAKELPYWDRVYSASKLQYDPIENYHRTETETTEDDRTEEHSGTDSARKTGTVENVTDETSKETNSGTDRQSMESSGTETHSGNDTVTTSITGFDSDTLVTRDQSTTAHGHIVDSESEGESSQTFGHVVDVDHDNTETATYNTTDAMTHGEKIEHAGNISRSLEAYGNIGTMTSQDMLTQEIEVAKIVNVIPIIVESFKDRFCLMVY